VFSLELETCTICIEMIKGELCQCIVSNPNLNKQSLQTQSCSLAHLKHHESTIINLINYLSHGRMKQNSRNLWVMQPVQNGLAVLMGCIYVSSHGLIDTPSLLMSSLVLLPVNAPTCSLCGCTVRCLPQQMLSSH